jgi:hypothetical protein
MNPFAKKKKKRLPFQANVLGGKTRSRPDRVAKRASGGGSGAAYTGPRDPAERARRGWGPSPESPLKDWVRPRSEQLSGGKRAPFEPRLTDESDVVYKRGGHLSMAQRKALPSSSFALPGKGKGPSGKGAGSYPIPDASHARNALSRVSQHGSSAQKAAVRAKVKAKFPGIGQSK